MHFTRIATSKPESEFMLIDGYCFSTSWSYFIPFYIESLRHSRCLVVWFWY